MCQAGLGLTLLTMLDPLDLLRPGIDLEFLLTART